jgi:hypothetical protein
VAVCIGSAVASSVTAYATKIEQNPRREEYAPMIQAVRANLGNGGVVMGGSELGFALGFQRPLVDDRYLGYYSGVKPRVFVENNYYAAMMSPRATLEQYVRHTLQTEYKQVLSNPQFRVWVQQP